MHVILSTTRDAIGSSIFNIQKNSLVIGDLNGQPFATAAEAEAVAAQMNVDHNGAGATRDVWFVAKELEYCSLPATAK